jgi:hypothetical protein
MDWFLRQTLEQIHMAEWYDRYVMERYQERKCALLEALDLAQEQERVRRKNETRLFVLDVGSVQCGEF